MVFHRIANFILVSRLGSIDHVYYLAFAFLTASRTMSRTE